MSKNNTFWAKFSKNNTFEIGGGWTDWHTHNLALYIRIGYTIIKVNFDIWRVGYKVNQRNGKETDSNEIDALHFSFSIFSSSTWCRSRKKINEMHFQCFQHQLSPDVIKKQIWWNSSSSVNIIGIEMPKFSLHKNSENKWEVFKMLHSQFMSRFVTCHGNKLCT